MKKRLAWLLLALWAIASVAVLARFLYEGSEPEMKVRYAYELLAVNFPISVPVVYLLPKHPVGQWFVCTLAGFVQWVLIVPWLVDGCRRAISKRRRREHGS